MEEEKEKRILFLALSYYSREDVQKAIFEFCKNREAIPRHFDSFGKRPQTIDYPSEIFRLVKSGYTSFHCSEELWTNPLELETGLKPEKLNELRTGWDLLIDIDCPWIDFSKKAAEAVIQTLKSHGVKNIGVKFSGGKGFHIVIPWKAFPKEINNQETKNLFPEIPRKIIAYIRNEAQKVIKEMMTEEDYSQFKNVNIKKGIKCKTCNEIAKTYEIKSFSCPRCKRQEIKRYNLEEKSSNASNTPRTFSLKCPDCRIEFELKSSKKFNECNKCSINSNDNPENFSSSVEIDLFELMGLDIVLVSPRHLFRAPYSLHEKGRVSVVLSPDELSSFTPKFADPLRVKIKNFYPDAEEGEAKELLISALDWAKEKDREEEKEKKKELSRNFQEIKIDKRNIVYPPCIEQIMKGMADGKKRALFILINYFRSLNFELEEIEKKLMEWNKKNNPPLRDGYILAQLSWAKRQKSTLPPNCDKDYYSGIAVCNPDNLCRKIKNPVNYSVVKSYKKRNEK
ncbi:hypothetical protein HYW76_03160 [Candidatus Pacearchaeota archaeon]|nr:hypothetical protein [Candidatus Pacearchaeota archaeon]